MTKRKNKGQTEHKAPEFRQLLTDALTMEGKLSDCYSVFWNYSFGNQLLAYMQLGKAEPINTFKGWEAMGRKIKKGSKAIELCMPYSFKTGEKDEDGNDETRTGFGFRRNWFSLSMTDGYDYEMPEAPGLDVERVMRNLNITYTDFDHMNGNTQGFSRGREIAINPVAKYPLKTLFHELGHIVLGHTGESQDERTARNIREVEAESVAYLMCHAFGYTEPATEARGYIQNWLATDQVDEATSRRIFKAASDILNANKDK